MKNLPVMTILMLAIFVTMVGIASTYPEGARFMTFVVGMFFVHETKDHRIDVW